MKPVTTIKEQRMAEEPRYDKPHFTTRRSFITGAGFGVVGLYGLWAAYGAAPLGIFHGSGDHADQAGHAPSSGHGAHGASSGPAPAEFRKLAENFVETWKLPDGSVHPRTAQAAGGDHARHGAAEHAAATGQSPAGPIDVYYMAYQWGFTPAVLRLDANARYRFRLMAVDVTHGAAIRIGAGSRITRLRTGALVEQEMQFTRPGEYLVYCTVYCGMLHDRMRGTIIVA